MLLALVAFMILGVHPAVAAELRVTNDGVDSATCGSQARPCRSISQAIENVPDVDTIEVVYVSQRRETSL